MPDTEVRKTSRATEMRTDLAKLHLRSVAAPMPQRQDAFRWQVIAGAAAAVAARLMDSLIQADPAEAEEIAGWYEALVGQEAGLTAVHSWIEQHVAGADFEQWVAEAHQFAVQAKDAE